MPYKLILPIIILSLILTACGGAEEPLPTLAELDSATEAETTPIETTPIPTAGNLAQADTPTVEVIATDVPTIEVIEATAIPPTPTQEEIVQVEPTVEEVVPAQVEEATPTQEDSGLTVLENPAGASISLELPQGWTVESGTMLIRGDITISATVVVTFPPDLASLPLQDIPTALVEEGESLTITETTSNGRTIVISTTTTDSGQETVGYLVNDSDGDAVAFYIQPFVENKDLIAEDVLFMAGVIEVSE